jgi:hypothetical protein
MPPAYLKPYVKQHKNDAADAEAICEAVTRANMRFVETKTPEQQNCLMLHRTRHLFIRQQTAAINAIRAHLAEFGIVARVMCNGVEGLLDVVADPTDRQLPEVARTDLAALGAPRRCPTSGTIHIVIDLGILEIELVLWLCVRRRGPEERSPTPVHKIEIAPQAIDIAHHRRRRVQPFASIDPRGTALLVVDKRQGFMAPGAAAEIPAAREIVPNINPLAAALRQASGTVVWIISTYGLGAEQDWSTSFRLAMMGEPSDRFRLAFVDGQPDHALWPALDHQSTRRPSLTVTIRVRFLIEQMSGMPSLPRPGRAEAFRCPGLGLSGLDGAVARRRIAY